MADVLEIKNLHAEIEGKEILKGISLKIEKGKLHALMGPNGSGKSTLAHVIMGDKRYKITEGAVLFNDIDITSLGTDERSKLGLFLTFQNPVELSGVKLFTFLRSAYTVHYPDDKKTFQEFITFVQSKAKLLNMDTSLLSRNVNEGFSGGEKKKG
jgi:ABC-type transport system involved in Fe-S cluster assembly, ATPase component